VSPPGIRLLAAALSVLGVWLWLWLTYYKGSPRPWQPLNYVPWVFWTGWGLTAILGVFGSITGKDVPCRLTFAFAGVMFTSAGAVQLTDIVPFAEQFYAFGLSVLGSIVMLALVVSPLRVWPSSDLRHMLEHPGD
jgi:hypothetical protein